MNSIIVSIIKFHRKKINKNMEMYFVALLNICDQIQYQINYGVCVG